MKHFIAFLLTVGTLAGVAACAVVPTPPAGPEGEGQVVAFYGDSFTIEIPTGLLAGYDEDVDFDLRDDIEELTGSELLTEEDQEAVDATIDRRYQLAPEVLDGLLSGERVDYRDPLVAAPGGESYSGPWIAAVQPVSLRQRVSV